MSKRFLIIIFIMFVGVLYFKNSKRISFGPLPTPTPTPEPPFTTYTPPKIPNAPVYKVLLVGDSMTHALGPYGGRLLDWLQAKFAGKGFLITNYAYSTNILSLPDMLTKNTMTWNLTFPPILSQNYDVLIIESFAYNPLSGHSREEGLKLQTDTLDKTIKTLLKQKPNSLIVLMATIAPNRTYYAQKTITLTQTQRVQEVDERVAYLKNFISYAQTHSIPLINVYEKSQTSNGDGNLKYINPDDYIHPSNDGIELICATITDVLYNQNLLPH